MTIISWAVQVGGTNVGDEAIFLGYYKYLKKAMPGVEINLFCFNPDEVKKRYPFIRKATSLFKFHHDLRKARKMLKESDYVLFGGGHMLIPDLRYCLFMWYCDYLKIPVVVQNVGALPMDHIPRWKRWVFKRTMNLVPMWIFPRDQESMVIMHNLGVKNFMVEVDDMCYYLETKKKRYNMPLHKRKNLKVMVHVKPYNDRKDSIPYWDKVVKFITILKKKHNLNLNYVYFSDGDSDAMDYVWSAHPGMIIKKEPDPIKFLEYLKEYDLVIAMRKHIAMMSHIAGVEFVATDGDSAMYWQLKKIGKEQCLI